MISEDPETPTRSRPTTAERGNALTGATSERLRLLTITELAKALGVGVETARALVRTGEIASVRCGQDLKVPRPCVERYFAQLQDEAFERARRPRGRGARPVA